jgi:thioesterase domain-containing protein
MSSGCRAEAEEERVQPLELERYLHTHIPLSKAMAVGVVSIGEGAVVLWAPLEANINHRETVFGGSACALAMLAGWALVHVRLEAAGIAARLVIQRNEMEYQRPILGDFTARASLERPERWRPFTDTLLRRRKARISVLSVLEQAGQVVATFTGVFVGCRG